MRAPSVPVIATTESITPFCDPQRRGRQGPSTTASPGTLIQTLEAMPESGATWATACENDSATVVVVGADHDLAPIKVAGAAWDAVA